MKKLTSMMFGIAMLFANDKLTAQQTRPQSEIEPYALEVTTSKTTHLVFPYKIISVDKGSRAVLAQKAKGVDNILQVKAASENFDEASLTVITTEGTLYSFLVYYSPLPEKLNLVFGGAGQPVTAQLTEPGDNQAVTEQTAALVAEMPGNIRNKKDRKHGIRMALSGLFIKEDVLYYQLSLKNTTQVGYDISQLRFFISDQKRSKRTATQQTEIIPLYTHGDTHRIDADAETTLVFALPKHTIPDKKYLSIQLMEAGGGRHLKLKIRNKTIMKAVPPGS